MSLLDHILDPKDPKCEPSCDLKEPQDRCPPDPKDCEPREKENCQQPKDDCEPREKHADKGGDKGENCQQPKNDCEYRPDDWKDGKHEPGKWDGSGNYPGKGGEHAKYDCAKNDCDDGPSKQCETEEPHCPPGDNDDCDVIATLASFTAPDVVYYAIDHIDAGTFDMDYADLVDEYDGIAA